MTEFCPNPNLYVFFILLGFSDDFRIETNSSASIVPAMVVGFVSYFVSVERTSYECSIKSSPEKF
jgi:hypothetical protein